MAAKALPCPTVLRLLLEYRPETGEFFWKERSPIWFEDRGKHTRRRSANIWNAKYMGKSALTADFNGYRVGRLFDNLVFSHRAAWAIVHGHWPDGYIDHVNGDKADNRLENLREATKSENGRNRGGVAGSSSRYKGVCWLTRSKKWKARIKVSGKTVSLGVFTDERDAAMAYNEAACRLHGEFAWLNEVT